MSEFSTKFLKKHKQWLERTKEYLLNSDWYEKKISEDSPVSEEGKKKSPFPKAKALTELKETMLKNDKLLATNVASRLGYFIKKTEGDKHLPQNKKIRSYLLEIVEIFLNHCEEYLSSNNLQDIKNQNIRNLEIKFQDILFNSKIKIEDTLDSMGANDDHEEVEIKFFKGNKASLIMREPLVLNNQDIKLRVENIPVNWDIGNSKEMLLNMKTKDIPPYNHKKHFFDQELSTIQFWQEEYVKMKEGLTINGYFIHPWLYHHLNIFQTKIPISQNVEKIMQPPLRDNEWFFVENLKTAEEAKDRGLMLYGTRRFSKALRDDQILIYEGGIKKPIGKSKVGDKIYGSDGKLTEILAVSPQGSVDIFKVTLQDGRESYCCEDHLWSVFDYQSKQHRVIPLKEMLNNSGYKYERVRNKGTKKEETSTLYNYFIPISKEVNYPKVKLDIDPYYIGLWLGDGTSANTDITTEDQEIKDYIKSLAKTFDLTYKEIDKKNNTVRTRMVRRIGSKKLNPIKEILKSYDILNNKYIPEDFLISSYMDRLSLLQGLMDSDGTISSGGAISFSNTNDRILNGIIELTRSLGIHCYKKYLDNKYGGYGKVVMFTDKPIFRLPRKLERIDKIPSKSRVSKMSRVAIVGIIKVIPAKATCIRVNNSSKEFLTNDFIVTHNSTIMASYIEWKAKTKFNSVATLLGGNESDLLQLLDKVDTSMLYSPEALKLILQKTDGDKTNGIMHLGLKPSASELLDFSQIMVQNLAGGRKTASQKTAGGAPSAFVVDEIGKFAFLAAYLAALPSFSTPHGYKCVPILSGCVCAGTKVWNNKGDLINIEDIRQGDGILGYDINNNKISREEITYWQKPHKKECYKITTNTGRALECSDDHPILIRHRDKKEGHRSKRTRVLEFKEARDIKKGNQIAIIEEVPFKGTLKMWEPRLIGLLIGDGSYGYNKGVKFSNCDKEINQYVYSNFDSVFESGYITKKGEEYKETRIRGIRPELRKLGIIDQTKHNKTLPKNLHSYIEEDIAEMLGGFFDADGHVMSDGKNYTINLSSGYKEILLEVQFALQKMGIHGGLYHSKPNLNNPKTPKNSKGFYRLTISDRRSIIKFKDKIYFLSKGKQDRLNECVKALTPRRDKIPKELKGLRLERVVSVEKIGLQNVYNLTAGTTHTYIANGIVTHNTGGEADLSQDAMLVLSNPEAYNMIPMNWDLLESKIDPDQVTWKRRVFATFMPGQMGYEVGFKYDKRPLGEFLNIKNATDLNKIIINQADFKNNNKVLDNIIEAAEKEKGTKGNKLVQQKKVQNPRDPEDCFITLEGNPFPSEEVKIHRKRIIDIGDVGRKVFLSRDENGNIVDTPAEDFDLAEFPFGGGFIDAPVQLFEPLPTHPPEYGLYVAGMDDYKHDQSDGDSVGTLYIYKRQWFDPYSLTLVASYASRPNPRSKFDRQCYYLLKAFNALCFHENEDNNFKTYLDNKHESELYLAPGFDFAAALNLNHNGNRKFGWAATPKNIEFGNGLIKKYLEEEFKVEKEDGTSITLLGLQRIKDIGLLEEIQNYTKDGNFDRMRGFMGALMYSHYLDATYQYPKPQAKERDESKKNTKKHSRISPFRKQSSNYFRK